MLDRRYQYIDPNQQGTPLGFGNITPNMGKQWVRSYVPTAGNLPQQTNQQWTNNTSLPAWQQYTVARPDGVLANNQYAQTAYNNYVGQFNALTRMYTRTGKQSVLDDLGQRYGQYQAHINQLNKSFTSNNSPEIRDSSNYRSYTQPYRESDYTPTTRGSYWQTRYENALNTPTPTATPEQLQAMSMQDPDLYQLTLDYQNPALTDAQREEIKRKIRYRLTQNNDITLANIIRGG